MLKGEIIAVGTELLLGQIANTNAQYISSKMAEIGIPIYYHVAVGDNPERLKEVTLQAKKRSNLIIYTGGLGPTQDDLTKEVVAETLNKKLILDQETFERIKVFFEQRQIVMTENNKKQAMVFEESTVFANDYGLAAGIGFKSEDVFYLFLPGPPFEMKPMLDQYVIPWIKNLHQGHIFYSKVMRFTGIGEASLEEMVLDLIENQGNPTIAPLAKEGEVTLRLTANGKSEEDAIELIEPIEDEIHERLKDYHFGYGEETIDQVVFQLMKELKLSISTAESCTGGRVSSKLTAISGSSHVFKGGVVCYSDEIKNRVLSVPEGVLSRFGAVSRETATLLAENTLKIFNTDLAVAITGIAGPNTVEDKPVGLMYLGIAEKNKETIVEEIHLSGHRESIQRRATNYVFYYLWFKLKERLNKQ